MPLPQPLTIHQLWDEPQGKYIYFAMGGYPPCIAMAHETMAQRYSFVEVLEPHQRLRFTTEDGSCVYRKIKDDPDRLVSIWLAEGG